MKGKGALWLWVGVLVVFLAGCAFVTYKLVKRHQNRLAAQKWEVQSALSLTAALSPTEMEQYLAAENEKLDRYEVLRPVVDELDLINFWGMSTAEEAMEQLRSSSGLREGKSASQVMFVVSDKDKEMATKLAQAVGRSYRAQIFRDKVKAPLPPAPAN